MQLVAIGGGAGEATEAVFMLLLLLGLGVSLLIAGFGVVGGWMKSVGGACVAIATSVVMVCFLGAIIVPAALAMQPSADPDEMSSQVAAWSLVRSWVVSVCLVATAATAVILIAVARWFRWVR